MTSYHRSRTILILTAPEDITASAFAFGAFDFVVTPDDEWVMLECNPNGQWLWLEEEVGVQIAAGIADLLVSGEEA